MPKTNKGATLSVLSVDGENHVDGWIFTITGGPDASLFEIEDSNVIVGLNTDYVSPGDKYLTVQATKGPITYQTGLTLNVGDKGITVNGSTGLVKYPNNMIGTLTDTFSFRFAFLPESTINVNDNLLGVNGDKYGLVNVSNNGELVFNSDKDTLTPVFTSPAVTPNKWQDIIIEGYNDGASKIRITLNDEIAFDDVFPATNFSSDLSNPWRIKGASNDTFKIWSDVTETTSVGEFYVESDKFGDVGNAVDHVSLLSSGAVDVYTVWGDAGETVNLGTFEVASGSTVDHISFVSTSDFTYRVSNVGSSHEGIELVREDLSGNTGGMSISGNSSLMQFVVTDH